MMYPSPNLVGQVDYFPNYNKAAYLLVFVPKHATFHPVEGLDRHQMSLTYRLVKENLSTKHGMCHLHLKLLYRLETSPRSSPSIVHILERLPTVLRQLYCLPPAGYHSLG